MGGRQKPENFAFNISEKRVLSIFRVEGISEIGTLAVTSRIIHENLPY
jgi:hypothetical protein